MQDTLQLFDVSWFGQFRVSGIAELIIVALQILFILQAIHQSVQDGGMPLRHTLE